MISNDGLKFFKENESYQGEEERINEEDSERDFKNDHCEDELTDVEIEKFKKDLLYEVSELEWEFKQTKECLYNERILQVENKLKQAREGVASEFLHVVALVEESYKIRMQVAKHRMDFAVEIANKELDNELQIAEFAKSERLASSEEQIQLRLQENMCKLQIEHQLMDSGSKFGADLYIPGTNLEPRKKPVSLSPNTPRLIYQLPEEDIRSDINLILESVKKHKIAFALDELNYGKRVC